MDEKKLSEILPEGRPTLVQILSQVSEEIMKNMQALQESSERYTIEPDKAYKNFALRSKKNPYPFEDGDGQTIAVIYVNSLEYRVSPSIEEFNILHQITPLNKRLSAIDNCPYDVFPVGIYLNANDDGEGIIFQETGKDLDKKKLVDLTKYLAELLAGGEFTYDPNSDSEMFGFKGFELEDVARILRLTGFYRAEVVDLRNLGIVSSDFDEHLFKKDPDYREEQVDPEGHYPPYIEPVDL